MFKALPISVLPYLLLFNFTVSADPHELSEKHKVKIYQYFAQHGAACLLSHNLSFDDVRLLSEFKLPQGQNTYCFFACILKKSNLMNNEGKVPLEAVEKVISTLFTDERDKSNALKAFEDCSYVNDQPVSDGKKGCERAKLALQCLLNKHPQKPSLIFPALPGREEPNPNIVEQEHETKKAKSQDSASPTKNTKIQMTCSGVMAITNIFPFNILSNMLIPTDILKELCSVINFKNK